MDDRGNISTLESFQKTYEEELAKKKVPEEKRVELLKEKP